METAVDRRPRVGRQAAGGPTVSAAQLRAVLSHRQFAVNMLADEQPVLSTNFARGGGDASWDGVDHGRLQTGLPRLTGTLAAFDCVVHEVVTGGDHEIVIGRVRHVHVEDDAEPPLLHWRGGYVRLVRA